MQAIWLYQRKAKKEIGKASFKLNIKKTKTMASSLITLWQIEGEKVEAEIDFLFLGSEPIEDGDCSHEIRRCLLLGRKAMTNLDSILKKERHHFINKFHIVKVMVFPVVIYRYENWTIK